MVGFGDSATLPDSLQQTQDGIWIFHGNDAADNTAIDGRGVWARLQPGHGSEFSSDGISNQYDEHFGIELSFARKLQQLRPQRRIALLQYARTGAPIDPSAAGDFGSCAPDYEQGNGINQFDHFQASVRHALDTADIDGDGFADRLVPVGIIWMQGESDAIFPRSAENYERNLAHLIREIRETFGVRNLPVVIGQISDSGNDSDGHLWDYGELVVNAQRGFVSFDRHAMLVTTTRNYGYSDQWHYDNNGYISLGEVFAHAIHQLQEQP